MTKVCDAETRILKLLKTEKETYGRGFWLDLQKFSDIPAQRWRSAYALRQSITVEMLDILGRLYPQYAFWLATGNTDMSGGHRAPEGQRIIERPPGQRE